MKRNYQNGIHEKMCYFVGYEVEKTPAYQQKTLFIEGIQDTQEIMTFFRKEGCKHLFFGANHSFNPKEHNEWQDWEDMIKKFLKEGYLCSLDIPIALAEDFLECELVDYNNFIPQLRVPVPYVKQWNYNTMLKIDDKDFKASNPGVWCHRLHNLLDEEKFTDWAEYGLDKPLL